MPSGTSDTEKPGRISKLSDTDYCIAWLDWLKKHGAFMVDNAATEAAGHHMLLALRDAFDAGWDARGLADIAIIDKHRPHRHG